MSASNCPETPRQKMIQMMYLVYTAMLALNVSAEVVEGFKTVGNAMTKSNENMEIKLQDTYDNFESALKNNPAKVQEKYDKAQEIHKLSQELTYTIDTVTYSFIGRIASKAEIKMPDPENPEKVLTRSIPLKNEDGTSNFDSIKEAIRVGGYSWIQKLDDNHAGTPYFIGKAEGGGADTTKAAFTIKRGVKHFKKSINRTLGEDSVHVQLGLDLDKMAFNSEGKLTTWEDLNFNNTVAGSAIVTLTRMKAEVMNAEFDAVNMLYKQIKSNDFSFDAVAVIARPTSSYVMQGGKYELVVNVGAYDSKAKFEATVGGQHMVANDTGAVVYTTTCGTVGPKTVTGTVYVKNDNGTEQYDFKQSYYVAAPMAVFELTKMNVVYYGIDNPIKISVPGTAAHDVVITSAKGDDCTITADKASGDGCYIIKPKVKSGKITINAAIRDGKATRHMGSQEYRVRMIPEPKLMIGKFDGTKPVPVGDMKVQPGVRCAYGDDFAFKMKVPQVVSQKVYVSKTPGEELDCRGKDWSPDIKAYVGKAKPGCVVQVEARVTLEDGSTRTVKNSWRLSK